MESDKGSVKLLSSLTVYVDENIWDKLDRVKIRLSVMLQIKGLDRFFERIIYTPIELNKSDFQ